MTMQIKTINHKPILGYPGITLVQSDYTPCNKRRWEIKYGTARVEMSRCDGHHVELWVTEDVTYDSGAERSKTIHLSLSAEEARELGAFLSKV